MCCEAWLSHLQPARCSNEVRPSLSEGPFLNGAEVGIRTDFGDRGSTPTGARDRPLGGGLIARDKLLSRVTAFSQGQWSLLINASQSCDAKSAVSRRRSRRRGNDLGHVAGIDGSGRWTKVAPFYPNFSWPAISFLVGGRSWRCPSDPPGRRWRTGRSLDALVI